MLLFVYGGSASGKSEYAEQRAAELAAGGGSKLYYIAAMKPSGDEARMRIRRHRSLRAGRGFETIERYTGIGGLRLQGGTAILECLSNLAANECFDEDGFLAGIENAGGDPGRLAADRIFDDILKLSSRLDNLVVVSLDVFEGGDAAPGADPGTLLYMRCLARLNRRLAQAADEMRQVIYSIPVKAGAGSCRL